MCDGSLQKNKRSWIIHSQSFSWADNQLAVKELNSKYKLQCTVIPHKKHYWVIKTHAQYHGIISKLVGDHHIPSMGYKFPG